MRTLAQIATGMFYRYKNTSQKPYLLKASHGAGIVKKATAMSMALEYRRITMERKDYYVISNRRVVHDNFAGTF